MELVTSESSDEAADPDPARAAAVSCGPAAARRRARAAVPAGPPRAPRDAETIRRLLYVPARTGSSGGSRLRFARTPGGVRTAVGFTSRERLTAAFGEQQAWILLAEPALRALAEPLGTSLVTVDPKAAVVPVAVAGAVPLRAGRAVCARWGDVAAPVPERPAARAAAALTVVHA